MSDLQPPAHLDLDLIETDLADVEIALARLDSGDYWCDEVTGQPLDDALLAERPTVRRAAAAAAVTESAAVTEAAAVTEVTEVTEVAESALADTSTLSDEASDRDVAAW